MPNVQRAAQAVERAYSFIEIKSVDEEKRIIRGTATTPTTDLVGDVVEPMGGEFKLPLPLLLHHNHTQPVGEVTWAKATKNGIDFEARIARMDEPGTVKDRLDEAWHSLKARLIRAVSIGFKNIEHTVLENGGWKFVRWAWLELSLVVVPANPDATIHAIRTIDREILGASACGNRTDRSNPAGASASHQSRKSGHKPMATISEQISALEAQKETLKGALNKFDVSDMSDTDEERFDELEADLEAVTKKLKRLQRLEAINSDKAVEVKPVKNGEDATKARENYQRTTVLGPNKNIPKGVNFARAVICLANAQGNKEYAADLAEKYYSDDKRISHFLRLTPEMKAAAPAAFTGDNAGWAETIAEAQTIGSEFIEFLRPMTIVDRLSGFRRVGFNVKVPRMTTGQVGYWVGEAKPTPMTSGVFDLVTMGKTKVGSISAMSKEQLRFSNMNAEANVRDDLAKGLVAKLDSTFIGTAAASAGVSPAGLLNSVAAQTSAGDTADDVRTDLANLYKLLDASNIDLSGVSFVTTGRLKKAISLMRSSLGIAEFPGDTLDGQPFIASNHVGGGDLVAISTQDILLADDGEVDISMSDQASLEMLDASLQQDATAGTGASLVNLWQSGLVAIKVERFINWQKARSAAVQFVGDATYQGVATA